jgi:hypothetical protein
MIFTEFTKTLVDDIDEVYSSSSFLTAAQEGARAIEENRLALVHVLRRIPSVVRLAKATLHEGHPSETFFFLDNVKAQDSAFQFDAHPDVKKDASVQEVVDLLLVRATLYAKFAQAQCCAILLYTDGTEAVNFSWAPEHEEDLSCVRYTTWSTPQLSKGLPHDFVGFLVGTGILYGMWCEASPSDLPPLTSVLNDGSMRQHTFMPHQAAALNAVDRWPVIFESRPQELLQSLSELVAAPFPEED